MGVVADILWRALHVPGHDACSLSRNFGGWELQGTAVWRHPEGPAALSYLIQCDTGWITRRAEVRGRVGERALDLLLTRDEAGGWTVNDQPVPEVAGALDIDLGFTPATNTLPLRRLMALGQERADVTAAWLDARDWRLKPLNQTYLREGEGRWRYLSPEHDFTALLAVDGQGFVTDYEGGWRKED